MCWKCSKSILVDGESTKIDGKIVKSKEMAGCEDCEMVMSYEDAMKHCPLLIKD